MTCTANNSAYLSHLNILKSYIDFLWFVFNMGLHILPDSAKASNISAVSFALILVKQVYDLWLSCVSYYNYFILTV